MLKLQKKLPTPIIRESNVVNKAEVLEAFCCSNAPHGSKETEASRYDAIRRYRYLYFDVCLQNTHTTRTPTDAVSLYGLVYVCKHSMCPVAHSPMI